MLYDGVLIEGITFPDKIWFSFWEEIVTGCEHPVKRLKP